mmetsp:Transcript_30155/g.46138  ORF Transcript_30155/g.46138 Transcript_30155/m.46138 type:complete len:873 (-) Transcript_30155:35-2653(-)
MASARFNVFGGSSSTSTSTSTNAAIDTGIASTIVGDIISERSNTALLSKAENYYPTIQFPEKSSILGNSNGGKRKRKRARNRTEAPTAEPKQYKQQHHQNENENQWYEIYFPSWHNSIDESSRNGVTSVISRSSYSSAASNSAYNKYTAVQDSDYFNIPLHMTITVTSYSIFLLFSVTIFILYLLLPKGLRQYMFNSYPKRYTRSSADREIQVLGRYGQNSPTIIIKKTWSAGMSITNSRSGITSRSRASGSVTASGASGLETISGTGSGSGYSYGYDASVVASSVSTGGYISSDASSIRHRARQGMMRANTNGRNGNGNVRGGSFKDRDHDLLLSLGQAQAGVYGDDDNNVNFHSYGRGHGDSNGGNNSMDRNMIAMGMEQRVDSGVRSGRRGAKSIGSGSSSEATGSHSHSQQSASTNGTWATWAPVQPHHMLFNGKPVNPGTRSDVMSEFKISSDGDAGEETIDFLSPDHNHHVPSSSSKSATSSSLPSPSLIEIESLASYSHASPSPSKVQTNSIISGGFASDSDTNGSSHGPQQQQAQHQYFDNDHTTTVIHEPSPIHPNAPYNQHRVPSQMVLSSTLTSLREPGIRLHAHGTQCDPRRIWIQLNPHTEVIEWKTEQIVNRSEGDGSEPKFSLGPVHIIKLRDVVFVDVGKTTAALQLLQEKKGVSDGSGSGGANSSSERKNANTCITNEMCLSILTRNGSLDLNAANKLERDALVSCFCLILDTIHMDKVASVAKNHSSHGINNSNIGGDMAPLEHDLKCWRDLHSSESSVMSRSTVTTSTTTRQGRDRDRSMSYAASSSTGTGIGSLPPPSSMGFNNNEFAKNCNVDYGENSQKLHQQLQQGEDIRRSPISDYAESDVFFGIEDI